MIKIDCGLENIDYIVHVADIHIRNWKRHTEYREVFEKLYELVKSSPPNTIVTVGGDIVHAKTDMSPELIDMVNDFFVNLAELAPTFVICGNHDTNLNNNNRLDALSPIFKALKQKNLYYLKDTELYEVGDVCFSVMSLLQPQEDYILASNIQGSYKRKIALYHGTVENSSTDTGIKLLQGLKMETFNGYDVALLGDIHKRQVLKASPLVLYPGSLVQQNFGEDYEGHGPVILNTNTLDYRFLDLPNRYGFYTLEVDGGVLPDNLPITSKTNLRLKVKNTSQAQLKRVLATIRKDYKISEPTINYIDPKDSTKSTDFVFSSGDIRRVEYQNDLIKEYLVDKSIDDDTLNQIYTINKQLNSILPQSELVRNVVWNPKKFTFSNMFSYGEDNEIDFAGMNGLCGLFAPNHAGKSAILDALCFCLFDHSFRASKAEQVLNNKSDWFTCCFNFELNGVEYFINKKAARYQKGPLAGKLRVDIDFWYVDENGDNVSLNGEQRRDTDKIIQSYIGTFDDFILTALSLQNNNSNFIDKTQSERKELLANFLDLCIFDQLYEAASKENKNSAILLEEYQKQDFETRLGDAERSKEMCDDLYKKHDEDLANIKQELDKQNLTLLNLTKQIKHTKADGLNLAELEKQKKNYNDRLESLNKKAELVNQQLLEAIKIHNDYEQSLSSYNIETITQNFKTYSQYVNKRDKLNVQLDQLKITIKSKLEKLQKLQEHEYDPNCSYCVNNVFVKDAEKTKAELEKDKDLVSTFLESKREVDTFIDNNGLYESSYINYNNAKSECDQALNKKNMLSLQENKIVTEKQDIMYKLTSIEDSISLYYANEEDIRHNESTQKLIDAVNNVIIDLKDQESKVTKKLQELHGKIAVANKTIKECLDSIEHMQELADKQVAYNLYGQAMSRDGIPYILISKAIPYIEQYVNNILGQIIDFTLEFEMDGKHINTYIKYDSGKWPLELSSGMERFLSSLAIRIALIKITNLPKPNFIALDEGLGVLDSTNLNSMHMLFTHMKSLFKHTLVISHIDVVRDMVDHILTIDRTSDFSHIKYP